MFFHLHTTHVTQFIPYHAFYPIFIQDFHPNVKHCMSACIHGDRQRTHIECGPPMVTPHKNTVNSCWSFVGFHSMMHKFSGTKIQGRLSFCVRRKFAEPLISKMAMDFDWMQSNRKNHEKFTFASHKDLRNTAHTLAITKNIRFTLNNHQISQNNSKKTKIKEEQKNTTSHFSHSLLSPLKNK